VTCLGRPTGPGDREVEKAEIRMGPGHWVLLNQNRYYRPQGSRFKEGPQKKHYLEKVLRQRLPEGIFCRL